MALNLSNLAVQVQTGTDLPRLFVYKTTDTIADVNTAGYFNNASKILKVLDTIFVYSSTDGTPALNIVYVNSNSGGVVDVTDGTTVAATDTD